MALVSHKWKFIYLKTHKTGSTSMELALEPFCAPPGHEVLTATRAVFSDEGIIAARFPLDKEERSGWVNHMPAAKVRKKLGAATFDAYTKVAMIRNPFDKAVSWYWHNNRNRQLPEGQELIEGFREFIAYNARKNYFRSRKERDWRVCHIGKKRVVDMFVPLERIGETIPALERRIGLPEGSIQVPHSNRKSRMKDVIPVADYYDSKTIDILLRHWGWIFEIGGYSHDPRDAGRASERNIASASIS